MEILVRETGVEPARPFGHKILSLARLPVPPLPQRGQLAHYTGFCIVSGTKRGPVGEKLGWGEPKDAVFPQVSSIGGI